MAAVIVALWRMTRKHENLVLARLKLCEKERKEQDEKIDDLYDTIDRMVEAILTGDSQELRRAAQRASVRVSKARRRSEKVTDEDVVKLIDIEQSDIALDG